MDKILFSKRLVDLRKDRGYTSQYALAKAYNEKFPPKRRDDAGGNEGNFGGILGTIKHYENGDFRSSPKLDIVCNLCKLLECDVSFLVGDYDEVDYATHKIHEYTGLSDTAIDYIHKAHDDMFGSIMLVPMLSKLLTYDEFWYLISELATFEHQSISASHRKEAIKVAQNDRDTEKRLRKDYKYAVTDKEVLRMNLQRILFRIEDMIEENTAVKKE